MSDEPPFGEATAGNVTPLPRKRPPPRPRLEVETPDVRAERAKQYLGDGCPYTPLGYDETSYYVISSTQIVRELRERDLSRNMMVSLADKAWLEAKYPRKRKTKTGDYEVYGIANEDAIAELIQACKMMGYWSPDDHVRGLGAWIGIDGDLVLHRGDHLYINGRQQPLGRRGDYVYMPRRALPVLPYGRGAEVLADSAAAELVQRLDTFRWARGTYDADLCLGWICCAILGAALMWRPHLWLSGEHGTGKSTLNTWLRTLFSAAGITAVTDTSAAGLYQRMGFDALPVAVDEFESAAELERVQGVVKLLRQASSGGLVLRGGSGHSGATFTVQSCFLCSAIIAPSLAAQDASRILTLELLQDAPGTHRPPFSVERVAALGAALTKRLADHYQRLVREVLPAVKRQMIAAGFTARMADQYGALWSARDVASHNEFDPARLAAWLDKQPTKLMVDAALQAASPEWRRCLDYLQASRIDRHRAESDTYGELIVRAAQGLLNETDHKRMQADLFGGAIEIPVDDDRDSLAARNRLARMGIQIRREPDDAGGARVVMMIAHAHRALAEVFQPTAWRTTPEASTGGGWAHVLKRAPGATVPRNPLRFRGGLKSRATILPIELVLGLGDPVAEVPPMPGDDADTYDELRPDGEAIH